MAKNATTWSAVPYSYFRWFYKSTAGCISTPTQVENPKLLLSVLERAFKPDSNSNAGAQAEAMWMLRYVFQQQTPLPSGIIQAFIPKLVNWFEQLSSSK